MLKWLRFTMALTTVFLIMTHEKVQAANIINGSFETGDFSNWETIGQTTVEDANFGTTPSQGDYQGILETLQDETGISSNNLEEFLGLSTGSLTNLGAIEGSAIKQTITVDAGDILSFSWNFLTDQDPPDVTYNDFAFFSISNIENQLADTNAPINMSFSRLSKEIGYQSYSYNFLTAGTYTLGFGVVDVGDNTVNSALVVDNIKLTKEVRGVTPIPEPTTILGTLIGLGFGSVLKIKYTRK